MNKPQDDWDHRILCSDGNCIGVVGPDGRCKECGHAYEGELPDATDFHEAPEVEDDHEAVPPSDVDTNSHEDNPAIDSDSLDDTWEDRTLCIDGNCIGIIGPDGRCKECGKPYPESTP
ncbi:MAG: hypothetical protein CSA23_00065 [Deltaproteobacteria bacterium]|nr:MAG: hypothetical protein CSA23_00065 [Deltaproteobacteria bacterium]